MPIASYDQALDRAAELSGIEPQYWDIFGRLHVTSAETKRAILRGLGVPAETEEQIAETLEELARRHWERVLDPSLVVSVNQRPLEFALRLPEGQAGGTAAVEIALEDGSFEKATLSLDGLPETGAACFGSRRYVQKRVTLDRALPLGYHEVRVAVAGGETHAMRLIVTPDRAYTPEFLAHGGKTAGIALSLYGVRSGRNWGCGDIRDLRAAVDWVADEIGASFIALNPLHAIHNRKPYNTSPYLPNSVFYRNPIYLDIEGIEGFDSPEVRRLWTDPAVAAELAALRGSEFIEYERVVAIKMRFLRALFSVFVPSEDFAAYIAREGDLLRRFATYCALDEALHRGNPDLWVWPDWPAEYRNPESSATRQFQKEHQREIEFHGFVQWQLDRQLEDAQHHALARGLEIGLYHDLALATDRCGSDLWAHREFYVNGCRVGSPPDAFSPKGQDWAFPPPNSNRHWETGYRLFTESIRKTCQHGGALRIDHVMRFFRLYWIPQGTDATEGTYVRDRAEDLIRILALESVRNKVLVIGEDLGTVEPYIRESLSRFGILSYRLLFFERRNGGFKMPGEYPVEALVSTTTHDLATVAGFWLGTDIEARRQAGTVDQAGYEAQLRDRQLDKQKLLDALLQSGLLPVEFSRDATDIPELTGDLHNAVIGFLASAPSMLLAVNQEDLTKEIWQQNLPGTTAEYPNWSRKMKFTLEELRTSDQARDFSRMLRHWLIHTART